ncbi:MAG: hypothetical protein ABIX28_00670, partial [Vicinamibacterales bacterium]
VLISIPIPTLRHRRDRLEADERGQEHCDSCGSDAVHWGPSFRPSQLTCLPQPQGVCRIGVHVSREKRPVLANFQVKSWIRPGCPVDEVYSAGDVAQHQSSSLSGCRALFILTGHFCLNVISQGAGNRVWGRGLPQALKERVVGRLLLVTIKCNFVA